MGNLGKPAIRMKLKQLKFMLYYTLYILTVVN